MTKKSKPNPVFNYIFTYNNYTEEGEKTLKEWLSLNTKYSIFGHEIAPTTGTPHLQGYLSLKKKMRMTTLQKVLVDMGVHMSLILATGSAVDNFNYCTKADPNGYWICGDIRNCGQGARSDLVEMSELIKEGKKLDEIYEHNRVTFIQYHSGIKAALALEEKRLCPKIRNDLVVSVFYGDAGTGKTHTAYDICQKLGIEPFFINSPQGGIIWWDGYDRDQAIIVDDFKGWIKPHDLFRLLDKYPYRIPYKGGYRLAFYTHVFITSNYPPSMWYSDDVVFERAALFRRIHNIYAYGWNGIEGRDPEKDVSIIDEKALKPYDI